MKAWIRKLEVILTSTKIKKQMLFGTDDKQQLNISVNGGKYLSTMKDNFVVKISNLTYYEIVQIIQGEYYNIEIKCGYRTSGSETIFKGYVLYVSNKLEDRKTNTVYIICASQLVGLYNSKRLNLTLNSGINLYSAISFICKRSGIRALNIDDAFKHRFITEITTINNTAGEYINNIIGNSSSFVGNSDTSGDNVVSIWDSSRKDARKITIREDNIILTGGYPTISSEGLTITLMPTFNFIPGDVIVIDNALIDLSITSKNEINSNPGYFLDKSGEYMIYEIQYALSNRSDEFSIQILAKSKSLLSNITGTGGTA